MESTIIDKETGVILSGLNTHKNNPLKPYTPMNSKPRNWLSNMYPKDIVELEQWCSVLIRSKCVPALHLHPDRDGVASLITCIIRGAEVGLSMMTSIEYVTIINGRMTIWGDALLAIVKSSEDYEYLEESFNKETMTATCIAKSKRDRKEVLRTFSREDGEKAKLYTYYDAKGNIQKKSTYQSWEQRMLQMRARKWCISDTFPHLTNGITFTEDYINESGYEIDILNQKVDLKLENDYNELKEIELKSNLEIE